MSTGDKDVRRIVQIGDSKGVTLLQSLELTEFPTELGALVEVQIEHEDEVPCLKISPYEPTYADNARAD